MAHNARNGYLNEWKKKLLGMSLSTGRKPKEKTTVVEDNRSESSGRLSIMIFRVPAVPVQGWKELTLSRTGPIISQLLRSGWKSRSGT